MGILEGKDGERPVEITCWKNHLYRRCLAVRCLLPFISEKLAMNNIKAE